MKEQERVPGPGASSWIITDNERIAVLERQLAEAQRERRWLAAAFLNYSDHRDTNCAPMYGCRCGAADVAELAARILKGK